MTKSLKEGVYSLIHFFWIGIKKLNTSSKRFERFVVVYYRITTSSPIRIIPSLRQIALAPK